LRRAGYTLKLLVQFMQFAHENRAYWIVPLVLMLGITGFLIVATQGAAPLLYTLF
jgi:hypothetical protein